jgi:signal recognition particle subunit SRP19
MYYWLLRERELSVKDFDHVIVWTDYFNRNLSRRKGRKVSKDVAIFDPSIQELVDASKSAGFTVSNDNTNETARFPRRPYVRSGYIMLDKNENLKKSNILNILAEKIVQNRAKLSRRR